jgi:hypothetical protein
VPPLRVRQPKGLRLAEMLGNGPLALAVAWVLEKTVPNGETGGGKLTGREHSFCLASILAAN